jgi:DNA polymerase (family 10)
MEVAAALDMLADMMELDEQNKYKVIAVQTAARRVAETNFSLQEVAARGELTELPGIGEKIAAKIAELLKTGTLAELEEYKTRYPADLVRIQKVQGVGPRTARKVWRELGVSSLAELEQAGRKGRIAGLPGLGPKAQENILSAIARLRARSARVPLGEALPVAEAAVAELKQLQEARNVTCAGSVRRMRETVKDVDIIATATRPAALTEAFSRQPMVAEVIGKGPTKCSIRTHTGLQIDLRVVPPDLYGNLLQHFTGSARHNVALRELAISRGLKVSEYGVQEAASGKVRKCATEEEVYALLGLDYIEPELREDSGELEAAAAHKLPRLIRMDDIRGDLHLHSDWSDGKAGIREMALAARAQGYDYMAISDHTQSLGMVRGLTPAKLERQLEEIAGINAELQPFHIFSGCECDVKADATLDLPDELLARLDFVTVSVHSGFNQSRRQIMKRLQAAMENPHVRAIGHPTGRIINRREAYDLDIRQTIDIAAATGTALEINSHYLRLDLNDLHARAAQEAGVRLVINSDAHEPAGLGLAYGVATARRGWIQPETVLNALPRTRLAKLLARPKKPAT